MCKKIKEKTRKGQRMAEAASNNLRRKVYVETASVDEQILLCARFAHSTWKCT